MKKSRNAIIIAVTLAIAVAIGVSAYLLSSLAPQAVTPIIVIFIGLWLSFLFIISFFFQIPYQRMDELREALRALSLGARDNRLNAERFGELSEIASAYNEVVGALAEGHDPNLGPVISERRKRIVPAKAVWENDAHSHHPELGSVRPMGARDLDSLEKVASQSEIEPKTSQLISEALSSPADQAGEGSDTQSAAKKSSKDKEASEEASDLSEQQEPELHATKQSGLQPATEQDKAPIEKAPIEAVDEARQEVQDQDHDTAVKDSSPQTEEKVENPQSAGEVITEVSGPAKKKRSRRRKAAQADPKPSEPIAEPNVSNDTLIDALKQSSEPAAKPSPEQPVLSGISVSKSHPEGLQLLFDALIKMKKEHGEAITDLAFEPFSAMIEEERDRLLAEHGCQDVRFEVTYRDGEVSLQPRVIRHSQIPV